MATNLQVHHNRQGDWDILEIRGSLIEGTEEVMAPFTTKVGPHCIIDMGRVSSVNSSGIAEWVEALTRLERGRVLMLQDCSVPVVEAMNLAPMFLGTAKVRSVIVPMCCSKCSSTADHRLLIEPTTTFESAAKLTLKCPKCSSAMLPEPNMEDYLSFTAA